MAATVTASSEQPKVSTSKRNKEPIVLYEDHTRTVIKLQTTQETLAGNVSDSKLVFFAMPNLQMLAEMILTDSIHRTPVEKIPKH